MVKAAPDATPAPAVAEPAGEFLRADSSRGEASAYDARAEAKRILRTTAAGALATLDPAEGSPVATLVSVATDYDGAPILLTSALSVHSRNMKADPRVSLLLAVRGKGDPLAHPRLTLFGRVAESREDLRARLRTRFLARHPKAALYADFGDFSFWRIETTGAHFNGGFAKAAQFERADLLTPVEDADSLIAAEPGALAHLNADHADALDLYARVLAGAAAGRWRAVALDPEGVDLSAGDRELRVNFPHRVSNPSDLRRTLAELAAQARAATAASP